MILWGENLIKKFGEVYAINGLVFEVEEGEIFGIAGPNGAGKTTLFNLISGMLKGQGKIIFDGIDISRFPPHKICHMGIARTFQVAQIFPTMTVFTNVEVGARFGKPKTHSKHNIKKIVNDAINFVGLQTKESITAEYLDLYGKKLTMLAATLATRPKVLLLDEPVAGLSPTEIRQIVRILKKINSELGITILIIEHLMSVLTELARQIMIMHDGKQICIGPPREIAQNKKVIEVYLGEESVRSK